MNWDAFKWRNHQPDIGRFFNVDPLAEKYLYNSPYAFSENKVVAHRELEGLEAMYYMGNNPMVYITEGFRQYFQAPCYLIDRAYASVSGTFSRAAGSQTISAGLAENTTTVRSEETTTFTARPNWTQFWTNRGNKPAGDLFSFSLETTTNVVSENKTTARTAYGNIESTTTAATVVAPDGTISPQAGSELSISRGPVGLFVSSETTPSSSKVDTRIKYDAPEIRLPLGLEIKFNAKAGVILFHEMK